MSILYCRDIQKTMPRIFAKLPDIVVLENSQSIHSVYSVRLSYENNKTKIFFNVKDITGTGITLNLIRRD